MLLKIIAIGICTSVITIVLKQIKPEMAMLSSICGGLIIFMLALDGAEGIIESFFELESEASLNISVVKPILKVLGVGYITEFAANLAEDSGNKGVASKIILGGKIAICSMALPILKQLIASILSLI